MLFHLSVSVTKKTGSMSLVTNVAEVNISAILGVILTRSSTHRAGTATSGGIFGFNKSVLSEAVKSNVKSRITSCVFDFTQYNSQVDLPSLEKVAPLGIYC